MMAEHRVPTDYKTIQSAIAACAFDGDVIILEVSGSPFRSHGNTNINFGKKDIKIRGKDSSQRE